MTQPPEQSCPLDNTEYQKHCCLYESYKQNGRLHACGFKESCTELLAAKKADPMLSIPRLGLLWNQ